MPSRQIQIATTADTGTVQCVLEAKRLASQVGFSEPNVTLIATAVSELARNVEKYAGCGQMIFTEVQKGYSRGVEIVARDEGPGIADPEQAMQDHFSTGNTLGLGLSGVKRMMDEFELETEVGKGTVVTIRKWL